MFSIKTQSRIPIFEQLKKQILEYISAGVLHGDDQLPSVRMLASSLGINPNTVAKAYQELEEKRIIYKVQGKGCFIRSDHIEVLVREEKLAQFDDCVRDMKRHSIDAEDLEGRIRRIYDVCQRNWGTIRSWIR